MEIAERLTRTVEVRTVIKLTGYPPLQVRTKPGANTWRLMTPSFMSLTFASWAPWGPIWSMKVQETVPEIKNQPPQNREVQEIDLMEVPDWIRVLIDQNTPTAMDI
jgi:hypothetical protein